MRVRTSGIPRSVPHGASCDAQHGDACKLFVAGLPEAITDDILRLLVESTGGTVVEATVPRDRTTGRSRRFGFVTLDTADEADAAREALDGSIQGGKTISVRAFRSEPSRAHAAPSAHVEPVRVVLTAAYRVTVAAADARRVEQLLTVGEHAGIVRAGWTETRVFSWEGVPDAAMRELRRAIGGETTPSATEHEEHEEQEESPS